MTKIIEMHGKWNDKELFAFSREGLVNDREKYLAWRKQWKAMYKELSEDIRTVKGMRKKNKYQYRDPSDRLVKRRVVVGDNPYHQPESITRPVLHTLRQKVYFMEDMLDNARYVAGKNAKEAWEARNAKEVA